MFEVEWKKEQCSGGLYGCCCFCRYEEFINADSYTRRELVFRENQDSSLVYYAMKLYYPI